MAAIVSIAMTTLLFIMSCSSMKASSAIKHYWWTESRKIQSWFYRSHLDSIRRVLAQLKHICFSHCQWSVAFWQKTVRRYFAWYVKTTGEIDRDELCTGTIIVRTRLLESLVNYSYYQAALTKCVCGYHLHIYQVSQHVRSISTNLHVCAFKRLLNWCYLHH